MGDSAKSYIYAVIALIFFSLMTALVKFVQGYVSTFTVIFIRSLISLLILLPFVLKSRPLMGKNKKILLLRGLLGFCGLSGSFYAMGKLPLVDASLLFQAAPLFVLPFSALFLKEKANMFEICCMLLGFIGIGFVIKPTGDMLNQAAIIGLLGAVCAGGAYTAVRALGKTENPTTIVFYYALISVLGSLPLTLGARQAIDLNIILLLFLIGLTATIAQISMTRAYRLQEAKRIAIINYLGVPIAAWIGFVFWSEVPDIYTILGTMMVISAMIGMNLKKELKNSFKQFVTAIFS